MKKSDLNDGKDFQMNAGGITLPDFENGPLRNSTSGLYEILKKSWAKIVLAVLFITNLGAGVAMSQTPPPLKTLSADGKMIITSDNEEVIMRGVNLGQWLVMEGFMSGTNGNMSQVDMKRKLYDSGMSRSQIENYFKQWRDNFITKKDIDFIASKGFNCVRLPLHYDLFLTSAQRQIRHDVVYAGTDKETKYTTYKNNLQDWVNNNTLAVDNDLDGFQIIDNLVSWCKANGIYIILDMHVVPGTAGDKPNITDQLHTALDFFEDSKNRMALYRIWDKISERYKDESTICLYDLINEPHKLNETQMGRLRNTYNQIINDIRSNGDNTLICIQGTELGNHYKLGNHSLFPGDFDNATNLVYNIHRYRLPNNTWEPNKWGHQHHTAYFADAIAFQ